MTCILYIPTIIKYRIFQQTNCFRFANVINNTTMINHFYNDNDNTDNIKTLYCQIIKIIAKEILKFNPMIKKSTVTNHTFFAVVTFSRTNHLAYINSIVIDLHKTKNWSLSVSKRSFKDLTPAFLVKASITHNKYLRPWLKEDNEPISAKPSAQILPSNPV